MFRLTCWASIEKKEIHILTDTVGSEDVEGSNEGANVGLPLALGCSDGSPEGSVDGVRVGSVLVEGCIEGFKVGATDTDGNSVG